MRNQQTEENKRHHEMFGMSFSIKFDTDVIAAAFFNQQGRTYCADPRCYSYLINSLTSSENILMLHILALGNNLLTVMHTKSS